MTLYPQGGAHWWSENDHRTVVAVVEKLAARRVLEFGPGTSTLSLIEGGADYIDTCEDDPEWFAIYCRRLEDAFPTIVHMRPYRWMPHLFVPSLDDERYDLGLIDGPRLTERRPACLRYALERCRRVLIPLEEGKDGPSDANGLRPAIRALERPVEYIQSGPLAGEFALIGPPC